MFFKQVSEFVKTSKAYLRRMVRIQTGNFRIVDVGGNGDCGFRSVAAGIINNALVHPQLNRKLLNQILNRHFRYFPWHRPKSVNGLMTPNEVMNDLVACVDMPELIKAMGYTLRQLAVDELVRHPEKYPGAFVENNEKTAPEMMRKPRTWIDESSIVALSNALNLPVKVNVMDWGKELASSHTYNGETGENPVTNPKIVMQLEGNHYMPQVPKDKVSLFKKKCWFFEKKIKPPISDAASDKAMPAIMKIVNEEEQRIAQAFISIEKRLTAMMIADELNKDRLLEAYIKAMNTSDYLQTRTSYVNKARGDEFFSQALGFSTKDPENKKHSPQLSSDEELVVQLIDGLARELSVKSEEHVEEFFEEISTPAKISGSQLKA